MSRLRVFAVLFGMMLLGIGELGLRFTLGPPPPAVRVFSALGQKHPQFLEEGSGGWATTYQMVPTVLHEDTYAVVVGGSTVHRGSPGVVTDSEFPAIAGRGLGRPVLNLGAPGLDSHDLLSLVEELTDLPVGAGRPEVIVVYAGHNDFGNARFHARYGSVSSGLSAHLQSRLESLQIYSQLGRLVRPVRGMVRSGGEDDFSGLEQAAWEQVLRHFAKNVERLRHVTERAGIHLTLVTPVSNLFETPRDSACDAVDCPPRVHALALERLSEGKKDEAKTLFMDARDQDRIALRAPTSVAEMFRELAEKHPSVSVVDAVSLMPRHWELDVVADQMFVDPIHLSHAGHAALGALLADHLVGL